MSTQDINSSRRQGAKSHHWGATRAKTSAIKSLGAPRRQSTADQTQGRGKRQREKGSEEEDEDLRQTKQRQKSILTVELFSKD